jgi:spore coat polysaccharide biosynthesis protein SpsF (cytidylyltransferase family)
MIGTRRVFNIPDSTDKVLIIQKVGNCLNKKLRINPDNVLNYIIVKTSDDENYEFIDNKGETDGFETFQGAEQFARAYILANYDELGHRWYINEFPKNEN